MTTIRVTENHQKTASEAKAALAQFEEDMGRYQVHVRWMGYTGSIEGTGVSGHVDVNEKHVLVELKLGLLAKMVGIKAERLKRSIEKRLKAALNGEA